PWGLWVGLYIYLVGVSGGAFLVAFLHHGLGVEALRRESRYAVPLALFALGAGLTLVLLDLGQMGRFWYLFARTSATSLLGWMVWVYTIYALVLVAMLAAMMLERRRALRWLAWVGLALVVTFGGGEGALFGVLGSKPFWNSGILPIRFLFSAFLSGVAVVAFATALLRRWPEDAESDTAGRLMRQALLALLVLNIVIEFAEVSVTLYTGLPPVVEAYRLVMFGPYWWLFWIVQVGLGLVVPLVLLVSPAARRPAGLGLAGLLVAVGYAASKQNLVLPGLAIPEFRTLPEAFVHPRLTVAYFPSATEWYVAIGIIGAAALAFVLAVELLPFLRNHEEWGAQRQARRLAA
ncbi:MAG TPA: NrfD/PsrC family molybdoenzyme membrane anchor subunit, partial [Candidatus Polarisedimenticolia bacterium]|nr:NrfD/PsrC family molybdoenzyme membrane anchor subunit [Candidatus Polarisedimenticolia bacterium]